MYLKNKAFRFDIWTFVLSSKLSCSKANKELCHTGSMTYTPSKQYQWVSQNIDDHILLSFFIILMNEKGVSISVYLENKTTIIRLSPCVHITFWAVTFRFLWMLTSYVTGGCCHISVVPGCYGSPLKTKSVRKDGSKCRKIDLVLFSGALLVSCSSGGFGGVFPYARGGDRCAEPESDSVTITLTIVYIHQSPQSDISHWHTHWICIGMIGHAWLDKK